MDRILETWNLRELIPIFKENCLDEESFILLTEKDIENLIPQIGLRLKLLQRWRILLLEKEDNFSNNSVLSNTASPSVTSFESSEAGTSAPTPPVRETVHYVENLEQENELLRFLKNCNEGKEILALYALQAVLQRRLLVKIIIGRELQNNPDQRIPKDRFIFLSEQICSIFKEEHPNTYFIPARRDSLNRPVAAHGKLWDRYVNVRAKYRRLQIIHKKGAKPKENSNQAQHDCIENIEILTEKLNWLKANNQPWEQVTEYWIATLQLRQQHYKEADIPIHVYFKTYPALTLTAGHTLISADFNLLYPEKSNNLFSKWPVLCKSILRVGERKRCPLIKIILNKVTHLDNGLQEVEKLCLQENGAFLIFPLLFPNTYRSKKRGHAAKFSKTEMQDHFITYVENEEDLNIIFEQREANARLNKKPEQPSLFFVGNLVSPRALLKINDIIYELETPLKSVDVCFKSFFVLNALYPPEAEQSWTYIQTEIFNITSDQDIHFNSVSSLHSDLLQDQHKLLEHVLEENEN